MADTRELSREVMNIRQASAYLGVSTDTLYKYVYEEKIPAFKLGNRWKFKKTILDAWMEKKSLGGNAEDKGQEASEGGGRPCRCGYGTTEHVSFARRLRRARRKTRARYGFVWRC